MARPCKNIKEGKACGIPTNEPDGICSPCRMMIRLEGINTENLGSISESKEEVNEVANPNKVMKKCPRCGHMAKSNVQKTCHACGEIFPLKVKKAREPRQPRQPREKAAPAISLIPVKADLGVVSMLEGKKEEYRQKIAEIDTAIDMIRKYA